ncbi:NAD-dependent epimerase/dehydratase family protein [Hyunsoonleella rubra]|uniref:NAD-dependent epimerase/dehydratase family protein n=1 Tax=Hyunsoonleella rubra TaxID=1737062 RepID=A0ABW5TA54_9FLAO
MDCAVINIHYFRPMVLVTGGTGLLGAHLLYQLATSKETVRAIYRTERKLENVKHIFSTYSDNYQPIFNRIEWVKADILDIPALDVVLKGVEYVYHCAAFVSFEPDKYQLLRRTNIEGTANVVNLSMANGVKKLCYVSSIATTGSPLNGETITEETAYNPEEDHSVYAITKYGAEMEVWRGTQEGLDAVVVNPGVVLGAGIWSYGSGNLFKRAYNGISYYTAGSVGLVAVQDVVKVMIELLKSDIKNQRYILVAENWCYQRFLQTLAKSLNSRIPKKQAKPWLLNIAWRLDWLKHKITGKRRVLTKHLAHSLSKPHEYSSAKINRDLNYQFSSIDDCITEVSNQYLKSVQ